MINGKPTNIDPNELRSLYFNQLVEKIQAGAKFTQFYESFSQYYLVVQQAIEFFKTSEEFEKCGILQKNLREYLEKLPKSLDECVKTLIDQEYDSIVGNKEFKSEIMSCGTFKMALELHNSLGYNLKDKWLLHIPETPLRKHFIEKYNQKDVDKMAHDIIMTFIDSVKTVIQQL